MTKTNLTILREINQIHNYNKLKKVIPSTPKNLQTKATKMVKSALYLNKKFFSKKLSTITNKQALFSITFSLKLKKNKASRIDSNSFATSKKLNSWDFKRGI